MAPQAVFVVNPKLRSANDGDEVHLTIRLPNGTQFQQVFAAGTSTHEIARHYRVQTAKQGRKPQAVRLHYCKGFQEDGEGAMPQWQTVACADVITARMSGATMIVKEVPEGPLVTLDTQFVFPVEQEAKPAKEAVEEVEEEDGDEGAKAVRLVEDPAKLERLCERVGWKSGMAAFAGKICTVSDHDLRDNTYQVSWRGRTYWFPESAIVEICSLEEGELKAAVAAAQPKDDSELATSATEALDAFLEECGQKPMGASGGGATAKPGSRAQDAQKERKFIRRPAATTKAGAGGVLHARLCFPDGSKDFVQFHAHCPCSEIGLAAALSVWNRRTNAQGITIHYHLGWEQVGDGIMTPVHRYLHRDDKVPDEFADAVAVVTACNEHQLGFAGTDPTVFRVAELLKASILAAGRAHDLQRAQTHPVISATPAEEPSALDRSVTVAAFGKEEIIEVADLSPPCESACEALDQFLEEMSAGRLGGGASTKSSMRRPSAQDVAAAVGKSPTK